MSMIVTKTEHKHDECSMCTRFLRQDSTNITFYKLESDHPQRNIVITLCQVCMDEVILQVQSA